MSDDLNDKLESLRVNYQQAKLDIEDCNEDPVVQFDKWLEDAIASKCDEANAFVLSTVSENKPRARVVLLKGVHEGEFIFYTNYLSAKGHEIQKDHNVAMTFLWLPLQRQIRIEGVLKKVDEATSDDYFHKRPRGSQIGAIASPQSKKMSSRAELEKLFNDTVAKYGPEEILPRPDHWGGYTIKPNYFEFWQGRKNRMHDRICYELANGNWLKSRLAP